MADISALRGHAQVQREASAWVARLNADDASEEDRNRFDAWRSASPTHSRIYEEVSATWWHLNQTGELVSSVALGQAFSASTQRAIHRSRRTSILRGAFAAAAVIAVVAFAVGWWHRATPSQTLFQTAVGEHATVQLPDGSSLELNSNSFAHVEYTRSMRLVRLERGEAFFRVSPDRQRPFWVAAGHSWVRALGTAFNVDMRSTGIRVTVSEGTVQVVPNVPTGRDLPPDAEPAPGSASVLKAGQQADLRGAASAVRSLPPPELARSVSWRQGTVYFKEERLATVVEELSRYTTLQMVIENDALGDLKVGGTFETSPEGADALLATLQDGFGLKIHRADGRAYIEEGAP